MTALTPSSLAESATACAWLPDEKVNTPAAFCCGVNCEMALNAPRNLKAPMRWKFSHLKKRRAPVIASAVEEVSTGVRRAAPATRSWAAVMSAKEMERSLIPVRMTFLLDSNLPSFAGFETAPRGCAHGQDH